MTASVASQTRPERLQRLLEVSRTLTATHDLPRLLQLIVDVARELTNSEGASILLYDGASGQLRFAAGPESQRTDMSQVSVPLDSSVAGWGVCGRRPPPAPAARTNPRGLAPGGPTR